ncbi:hypothetical protein [Sphingomonas sp. CFBP 13733]|uniref:hypothetical protein n=1 Tax=Sphingomonas sp. CFBP 13733 TaxID=2775291 RepID=UPI001783302E|nr:hypothetical protein [Sphingomonas sp. CFBP 13733]MBD8641134.1 hypothetical protein [Sphingomonas sp. CFBP 13733]
MARSSVQGLAHAYSLIDRLPSAAHDEMAVELAIIARELSAAQHQDVAKATGALEAALSYQLLLERLSVKVGLLQGARAAGSFNGRQRKALAGGPYYGRFVEFGRAGQTVLVTRRIKKRTVKGNGRNGTGRRLVYKTPKRRLRRSSSPNRGTYVGDPYKLRVKAKGKRPFVEQPLLQQVADSHLSDFWAGVLARVGDKP